MLVYVSNFDEFSENVLQNRMPSVLESNIKEKLGHGVSPSEVNSWNNSLGFARNAFELANLPDIAGVAVEFQIPLTSKRVDVLVSGKDEQGNNQVVLVELKQWQSAEATDKDGIVKTYLGRGLNETTHPSYQAWSYATFIEDYNEAVQTKSIELHPCSYLHNCTDGSVLKSERYAEDLSNAPLFLQQDVELLAQFINQYVTKGDDAKALYDIDQGRVRPSKQLIDHIESLLQGNEEFTLLDEQKLVAESITALEKKARLGEREVLIVEGGPGTGKSVLAINLLAKLTSQERTVQYITRNTAPRQVFESKLTNSFKKSRITNLFKSSGSYTKATPRSVNALLVDEAHRLSPKSGPFGNLGENQVKEIVHAADLSVFFLDEKQKVIFRDIGSRAEIEKWANHYGANISHLTLDSQFRCNGSSGYIEWLDNVLQLDQIDTESDDFDFDFDFRVFDSPSVLFDEIVALDNSHRVARVVAGYCWEWVSRKNPDEFDIRIPEHAFERRWNLTDHGNFWLVEPESINEIGCIHTCQGLEMDYVGVIIGPDLIVRNGQMITDPAERAKEDTTMRGYATAIKSNQIETEQRTDRIIKNTYRTLMTRGMKGCFVFCVDHETNEYFKHQIERNQGRK